MYKLYLLLMLLVAANACSDEKKGFTWTRGSGSLALSISDSAGAEHLLWRYNFQPGMKPYFHPLHAPDGTLLTAESPSDHAWHLGLWFCWKYINGLNYWEYQGDPKLALSEGMTNLKKVKVQTRSDGSAEIRMWIDYHPWDKPDSLVLKEYRLTTVSAPAKDGSYRIDFKHSFTAETDVLLDRTPVQTEPNGVTWGGYAGLSIRFNQ